MGTRSLRPRLLARQIRGRRSSMATADGEKGAAACSPNRYINIHNTALFISTFFSREVNNSDVTSFYSG